MRSLISITGQNSNIFSLEDLTSYSEAEFEAIAVEALTRGKPDYHCRIFTGSFIYNDRLFRPDLILVAKDFSHYFIIEVELITHSLDSHVLPQVRAFQFGNPGPDCIGRLASCLEIAVEQSQTMLKYIPRGVAVVANIKDALWESALRYNAVQLISIAKFTTAAGAAVFEIDGTFRVIDRSMGFARYSATDRSLLFPLKSGVPTGEIQIEDPTGSVGLWSAVATADHTWVTKKVGSPNLEDSTYVQMVRTSDGRFVLRKPL